MLNLRSQSKILDAPCGYGRHSINLASRNYKVVGIDIDQEHLTKANKDLSKEADISFLTRDLRNIGQDLYGEFDAVINMFYSFGFFESEEENTQTMREFYNALNTTGQLLIHTDVSPEMIKHESTQTDAIRNLPNGNKLVILETYNAETGRMEGSWETTDHIGRIIHPSAFYSMRIYSTQEFTNLAKEVGFDEVKCYGSFNGEPFTEKSKELILAAKKRGVL
ncbi:MAG: class I SAM-dependent methyltransferase [Planctomycetes bacterium]|nr:class I SAM-dependent methyltransferase [Planctomycetota bacterium]